MPLIAVAVSDVGGRLAGGIRSTLRRPGVRHDRCDTESKLVSFACGRWHGGTVLPFLLSYTVFVFLIFRFCDIC